MASWPVDRGTYYSGCQARDSSSEGAFVERQDTGLWKKKLGVGRQDTAVRRRSRVWRDTILLCNESITSVCSGVYGMSVRSARHCLRTCRGSHLRVNLTASLDGHRMSMWSGRHCRSSLSRTIQHITFVGVDLLLLEANSKCYPNKLAWRERAQP